jgi:ABC-type Fe3+/spermidine/putrescine transport system ATPase subunit
VPGDAASGSRVTLSIRPERWRCADAGVAAPAPGANSVEGRVIESAYSGSTLRQVVALAGGVRVVVARPGAVAAEAPGTLLRLELDPGHAVLLPADAGERA